MPKLNEIMFINLKNASLYLYLEKYSLYESSGKAGVSYTYAMSLMKKWAMQGLIYLNKAGKRYNVMYSPRGKRIAIALGEMMKIFREEDLIPT
jgi:hypothetical protein